MTNIDCPDCGRRVELSQNNIIPYHDNGSPIVCAGSGRQVSAASTQPRCAWCDALAIDRPDRVDPVREVLREAARCGDPAIEARADLARKILDVIDSIDTLAAHKREAEAEALFGSARTASDDALRRAGSDDGEARRREAAGE